VPTNQESQAHLQRKRNGMIAAVKMIKNH